MGLYKHYITDTLSVWHGDYTRKLMKSDFRKLLFYSGLVMANMKFITHANFIKCKKLTVEMKYR